MMCMRSVCTLVWMPYNLLIKYTIKSVLIYLPVTFSFALQTFQHRQHCPLRMCCYHNINANKLNVRLCTKLKLNFDLELKMCIKKVANILWHSSN